MSAALADLLACVAAFSRALEGTRGSTRCCGATDWTRRLGSGGVQTAGRPDPV